MTTAPATPFDDPHHRQSEGLALRAEREPDVGKQRELYALAAFLEELAARDVPAAMPRVRSVLARSAVALWWEAKAFDEAIRCGETFLAEGLLSPQGREQIATLVARCRHALVNPDLR